MMAFHLKKYPMLNVMTDGQMKDGQMKDVNPYMAGVVNPCPCSIPSEDPNFNYR